MICNSYRIDEAFTPNIARDVKVTSPNNIPIVDKGRATRFTSHESGPDQRRLNDKQVARYTTATNLVDTEKKYVEQCDARSPFSPGSKRRLGLSASSGHNWDPSYDTDHSPRVPSPINPFSVAQQ